MAWIAESVNGLEVFNGSNVTPLRPNTAQLRGNDGGYFAVSKPQYESYTAAEVVNVKTYAGAAGDGSTDDTHAIQSTLDDHKGQDVIIFFPAGTKIVGEVWSQIMASGDNFGDMTSPRVMVQVGNVGDVESVEIQDMLFATKGGTAGAVLMEWNIQASSPGSAAMWDSHFRVGGALGNELQVSQCPTKSTPNINSGCIAASMLLHLTSLPSAYLENVWAWTADHDMDDAANTMADVYSARGILIESKGPTWLYATASEHNVLYQYELYEAENIFMGMIQTESPYYPPVPSAPAPFDNAVGMFNAGPNFTNCNSDDENSCAVSWALRMVSSNVQIAGAGLYSWYQDHDPAEACVDAQNCQQRLVSTYLSCDIWLYNLITIGATEMVSPYGTNYSPALAAENTDATSHPYWSTINAWLLLADGATGSETPQPSQTITLADWWWGLSTPSASCWFPCVIVLPPVILPPMQAPVITSLIKGVPKTITPPAAETPTLTVDLITISGTLSISNAPTSTSVSIQFNNSAIILSPFEYTDDDDGSSQNISGIIIPLPIKGPPPRSNSDDDSSPGSSSSNCCPSISIGNSSPWPKPDTPEPPGLDNNNNDEEDDGSSGGSEEGSQPQEPESTSTTSTTSSTTTMTTTTTTTSISSSCTAIPTIAIATDGIFFSGTGTSGASASAWASSNPTVTNDPVFGAGVPVAVGGRYTPTSPYSIATNPGTSSSTTATPTTSSVKSPPTDSAGG
ncbi:hypothetical protein Asppvi_003418 [Aspergillus pseudoviridinutans]|uniref:Rhamnogalacturonase A/B/Epimerase-like pectate lyase domain-containing protein n=1 Tax=Aspergillus pseudoviridinutans TaxID=1517512 RepID=A0A9P3B4G5_9EURO|nr:uncharacterized protein Asppvi_003418 [Aspergillus pseudoviridinutans]GIJ84571.1 hypothetical protein Asppvi_003418 [Aspergillus pseudoviridinutans]